MADLSADDGSEFIFDPGGQYSEDPGDIVMFPTIDTLVAAAAHIGINIIEGADRILAPWEFHRQLFAIVTHPRPAILCISELRCPINMALMDQVVTFVETWNSERINPSAAMYMTDDGDLTLKFSTYFPLAAGASFAQVSDFMLRSCEVTEMAMTQLIEQLGDNIFSFDDLIAARDDDKALRQPLLHPRNIDGDPDTHFEDPTTMELFLDSAEPPAVFSEELEEVSIDLIASAWAKRGIDNVEKHEDFIITGINNILMAAFIDNGPSILLRGHWDCSFPAEQHLKAFLISNDWNRTSTWTRALWVEEEEGLQLRVECALPTSYGLTADQLAEVVNDSTQAILKAIDLLSVEISGSSAVHWPEQ
ncbi:YbjN domain-containing protein [Corynebacterium sp. H128]|uniref:YbjN domain-containing protein n=1 Tax=unclassified Corynebacterium TaxID=2624378 RepID=UPI003098060C